MKRWQYIFFLFAMISLMQGMHQKSSAQDLFLDEGLISIKYNSFNVLSNKANLANQQAFVRTSLHLTGSWFCAGRFDIYGQNKKEDYSDLQSGNGSRNFIYLSNEDDFQLDINIYVGDKDETDGNIGKYNQTSSGNCKDGISDEGKVVGFRNRSIVFNYSYLELGQENTITTAQIKVPSVDGIYQLRYDFSLTPTNNLDFRLETNNEEIIDNICIDEPLTIGVKGNTEGHYKIKSITYEYNYDNEQTNGVRNDNSCKIDPDQSTEECEARFCSSDPDCFCCKEPFYDVEPEPKWTTLGKVTVADNYQIKDLDLHSIISSTTSNGKILRIRSRIEMYNGKLSNWHESEAYTVYPGFPDFNNIPDEVTPACFGQANGSIAFRTVNPAVNLVSLKSTLGLAFDLADRAINDTIGKNLGSDKIILSGNKFTLIDLKKGDYTLVLSYSKSNDLCYGSFDFSIGELPELLKTGGPIVTDPKCFDGQGTLDISFLQVPGWQDPVFTLDPGGMDQIMDFDSKTISGSTISYHLDEIPSGENSFRYAMQLQDQGQTCTSIKSEMIAVNPPARVSANQPSINPATCNIGYKAGIDISGIKGGLSGTTYQISVSNQTDGTLVKSQSTTSDAATIQINAPGAYVVEIIDSKAGVCPGIVSNISLDPLPAVKYETITKTDNECSGLSEGLIEGRYSDLDPGIVQLYNSFGSLEAEVIGRSDWNFIALPTGTYTVKLLRSESCADQANENIEIKEPKAFDVSLVESPISCQDSTDAKLTAQVESYGRDYNFWWSSDGFIANSENLTFSSLSPGTYGFIFIPIGPGGSRVCMENADTLIREILEPVRVSATLSYDSILCLDPAMNVLKLAELSGGNDQYNIDILKNGQPYILNSNYHNKLFEIDTLSAGEYDVWVTDAVRPVCPGFHGSFKIDAVEPLNLAVSILHQNECIGDASGIVDVNWHGQSGLFIFTDHQGIHYPEKRIADNIPIPLDSLKAGNYSVALSRHPGCNEKVSQHFTITQPENFQVRLIEDPISCQDSTDATLIAEIRNFGQEFDFHWMKEDSIFSSTSLSIDQLSPGRYSFVYQPLRKDSSICSEDSLAYVIDEPVRVTASYSYDTLLCLDPFENVLRIDDMLGGSDVFDLIIHKNQQPYANLKDYLKRTFEIDTLTSGAYDIWVTDASRQLCPGYNASFYVNPIEELSIQPTVVKQNPCYGDELGEVIIGWNGQSALYSFIDTEGNATTEKRITKNTPIIIDSLKAGTYGVKLTRGEGCDEMTTSSFVVSHPDSLQLQYAKTDIECYGLPTGEISGNISGGSGEYHWEWWKDSYQTGTIGKGPSIQYTNLHHGNYQLRVADENKCSSAFDIKIVPYAQKLLLSLSASDITCYDAADGLVTANIEGGTLPYHLSWTNSKITFDELSVNLILAKPDTVFLTVTDARGCQNYDTAGVAEPPQFLFPDYFRLCNDQLFKTEADYEEEDVSYLWQSDNGFYADTKEVLLQEPGNYTVSVIRPNGCENKEEFCVDVLDVDFIASFLGASWIEVGDTVYLKEVSRPVPDSLFWEFDKGLKVEIDSLGDPLISADSAGEYYVAMYAFKDNCMTYTRQLFSFLEKGQAPKFLNEDIFGPKGIEAFQVMPNPNDGDFDIHISMYNEEEVALFLYGINGKERWRTRDETPKLEYDFTVSGLGLEPGTYVLMLVSKSSRKTVKVIVY
jgi:hypothetical protein